MESIRIVIVDDSDDTRSTVRSLLSFEKGIEVVGEAGDGKAAIQAAKNLIPDVILMDINMPGMDGIRTTEEINKTMPGIPIIIMSVQGEPEYFRKALTVGARDYLTKPFTGEELVQSIQKTYQAEKLRRKNQQAEAGEEEFRSSIITVFSPKGGVGKSTISTNLAVSLARITKKKVALVDLDLQFGDIAVMLNIHIKSTIGDLAREINTLEKGDAESYMVTHFSGVSVLPAPESPEYAEYVTGAHVERILKSLKESFHYIVVDTSASFQETVLSALDISDTLLMVSTLDIPTLKNVRLGLDVMKNLRYPQEKIRIVLNKATEQYGIKYKDMEQILQQPIWLQIPEDNQTVITTANKGLPFVMTRTETRVARAIVELAEKIAYGDAPPAQKGLFTRILKK